jgi:acyl phosphate:glycerol-3-phosphate acyltransferase
VPVPGYISLVLCAYLLGSIPTGYLVARAKGIDIRNVGSGNIGATNAFRVLGKPAGIFVLLADALKGYLACTVMADLLLRAFNLPAAPFNQAMTERVVAGIVAVLGHNFTCWLRFKGGKGIATTTGVYFAVAWQAALVAVIVWIVVLRLTRFVSVASIVAAVVLPLGVWLMMGIHHSIPLGLVTTAMGALAIWKHKANIARLKAGTENRMSFRRKSTEGTKA